MVAPFTRLQVRDVGGIVLRGRPKLRGRSGHIVETLRHYADDRVQVVIQRDVPAYDQWIGVEAPAPQCIAQDRHQWTFEALVGFLEISAQRRCDSQSAEVAGADVLSVEAL